MKQLKRFDKRNTGDILALTPMQEGMLFHYLQNPTGDQYVEQLSLEISGEIDTVIFEKAWEVIVETNEMLRTVFRWKKMKHPMQVVLKKYYLKPIYHDLPGIRTSEKNKLAEEIKAIDREKTFDLQEVPFRVTLCKIEEARYQMIISNHHILYDGWSNGIILKEVFNVYNDLVHKRAPVKPVKTKFKEYIKWINSRDKNKQEKFWSSYLKGVEDPRELAVKTKTGNKQGIHLPDQYHIRLNQLIKNRVERFIKRHKITLAALLYSTWGILLQKYNNSDDVLFGTTVSGRSAKLNGIEDMVGLFINTLPLRVKNNPGEIIIDVLNQVNHTSQAREEYQDTSLADIKGYSPLGNTGEFFDSLVVIENYPLERRLMMENSNLSIDSYSMIETTNYDLTVGVVIFDDIEISFVYNTKCFDPGSIERMSGHFCRIIENIIKNPGKEVHEIDLLSEKEKRQILVDFNDTAADYPRDKTIHQLFSRQVEQTPDNTALVGKEEGGKGRRVEGKKEDASCGQVLNACGEDSLRAVTYKELEEQSDRLAYGLKEKGVKPDTTVGIMMERSIEMIVGILGILKAGGAYLPIDPEYPEERIQYMLEDSNAKLLVTTRSLAEEGEKLGRGEVRKNFEIVLLDFSTLLPFYPSTLPSSHPHLSPAPATCLAYIIYTSGTTGKPKGTLTTHANVIRVVRDTNYINLTTNDRILQLSNYAFDGSVFDIYGALLNGAVLVMIKKENELSADQLSQTITTSAITVFFVTTALFNILVDLEIQCLSRIRKVLFGGERVSVEYAKKALEYLNKNRIIHVYGPTETTVYATYYYINSVDENRGTIPIGYPLNNTAAYIINKFNQLVPIGVPGELVIGGYGVARGYLNKVELTKEKFIRDPFVKGERLYRSGDIARWLSEGSIEFIGRIDSQVKIRGFRVELGEIENYICKYHQIKKNVVVAREDKAGEKYICAYIVTKEGLAPSGLREYLSSALPDFMVPSYFVQLDKIPLTPNGKVDRKALPEPGIRAGKNYVPPGNEIQKKLIEIWSLVLGSNGDIGIDDNFFHLGGHSLKAISLSSLIHKTLDVPVPLDVIFQTPTIRELARYLEPTAAVDPDAAPELAEEREYYPLSLNQQTFYVLHQYNKERTLLNVPQVLPLDGDVEIKKVEAVFKRLIQRHESLRTSFHMVGDEPVQKIHKENSKLQITNSKQILNSKFQITNMIENFIQPFDLSRAPLLRVGLVRTAEEKYLLIMDMHHIITDGASGNILAREFMALYKKNDRDALSPVVQYRDFVQWRKRLTAAGKLQEHEEYWLKKLSGDLPLLDMPTDFPRPSQKSYEGDSFSFQLERGLSESIRRLARETGTTLYMVLLTAYTILLHKFTGQGDIIVASPTAGRNHPMLKNTVGLVMDTLVMRNFPSDEKTIYAFLQEVRQTESEAFKHHLYPFEKLVKKLTYKKIPGRTPIADVALNVLNMFDKETIDVSSRESNDPRPLPHEAYFHKTSKVDITITALDTGTNGEIPCVLEYCTRLYKRKSMERFAARFQQVLGEIVRDPGVRLWEIDMIAPAEKEQRCYPLTHAQKRIYYTEKTYPGTSCNTLAFTVRYKEILNREWLETAINTVISRHEVLRLRILELDSTVEPYQHVVPYEREPLDYLDFPGPGKEEKINKWIDEKTLEPIPLLENVLFYFVYIRFNLKESGYYTKVHHIIADSWTSFSLFNEIDFIYRQLAAGGPVDVGHIPNPSYIRYIRDERDYLYSPRAQEDREFWNNTLLPLPETASLSIKTGITTDIRGGVEILAFPDRLRTRMHNYCQEQKTSIFKLVCAGLSIYISRAVDSDDIVIGSFSHNRSSSLHKQMMGMFVSTILFRIRVEEELDFTNLVEKTGQNINQVIKNHQKYPFDILLEEIREKTRQDPMHLLEVSLVGHGYEKTDRFSIHRHFPGYDSSPLSLHIDFSNRDIRGVLEIEWNYQKTRFSPGEIRNMHRRLVNILTDALENPRGKIAHLQLLSVEEKKRILYDFNDTGSAYPMDKTLPELLEPQVEKIPDNVALIGLNPKSEIRNPKQIQMTKIQNSKQEGTRGLAPLYITYRELNRKANKMAQLLIEKGVQADMIVGIMVERSVEMIIGILAILKAGGAYLPIDPGYPEERIRYMLADSKVKFLVKKSNIFRDFFCGQEIFVLDFEHSDFEFVSNFEFRISNLNSSNLAYIIYTSGTTGRPKGVMVQHCNLAAYLAAFEKEFRITPGDTVLQQASYSFDTFGEEVYPVLLQGGAIAIPPAHVVKNIDSLVDFIRWHKITIIDCSPLLLSELNKQTLPVGLRLFISGGDVLRGEYIGNLLKEGKVVYNTYGPTETTVCAAYSRCEPGVGSDIPIGKPIANYNVYILDKNKRLQPIGISGELCISGPGVTRGYLNNPELTAERFCLRRPGGTLFGKNRPPRTPQQKLLIKNKKVTGKNYMQSCSHAVMLQHNNPPRYPVTPLLHYSIYMTGDLARWLPDGNIQFLGRIDRQVNIRGFRIELSGIEKNLLAHEGVSETVVVGRGHKDKYICAYVVASPGGGLTEGTTMVKKLRAYLSGILPHYMVPAFFVSLQRIPLTLNGKINMKALPDPTVSRDESGTYQAPRDGIERILVDIWTEVLSGKDSDSPLYSPIGIDDNFYEIGGDSIKAIQIAARLKKYGLELKINDLFIHQTIRLLVESGSVTRTLLEIPQGVVEGNVALTPIQEWFFKNNFTAGHHFNQAVMLYRWQGFDEILVKNVFEKIVIHHDALRMVYQRKQDRVLQVNRGLKGKRFYLEVIQLEHVKDEDIEGIIDKEASRIQAGMNLLSGPLVRLGLFKTKKGDHLLVAIHHLVIDTVSWRILLEDFSTGYRQLERGEIPGFPAKTDSFQYWAAQLRVYALGTEVSRQLDYWKEIEKSAAVPLPRDYEIKKENKTVNNRKIIEIKLDKEETNKLLTQANRAYNTEINDLLLAALGMAVTNWAGTTKISITLEGHGREEIIENVDISRTVGWYTTRFPVVLDMSMEPGPGGAKGKDLSHRLLQVKEMLRRIPGKGIGYGILRYFTPCEKRRGNSFDIEPDISFNYLGQFDQFRGFSPGTNSTATEEVFTLSPLISGRTHDPNVEWLPALDINGMILSGQLTLSFSYNMYEYEKRRIEDLVKSYRSYLIKIIEHCRQKEKRELSPSDLDYPGLSIDELKDLQNKMEEIKHGAEIENIYPLTPMQRGILFQYLMDPSSGAYFEQVAISLRGRVDKDLLKKSFNLLVARHDILRTLFYNERSGLPLRVVLKHKQKHQPLLHFEDISHLSEAGAADYLRDAKKKDLQKKFLLMKEVPIRISLYQTGVNTFRMVCSYHHILMDGWGVGIIFKELMQVYRCQQASEPVQLPPVHPYRNYIKWLERQDKEVGLKFWKEYLRDYEQPVVLPGTARFANNDNKYELEEYDFSTGEILNNALNKIARQNRVTVNVVFQTAWGILLQRYNNTGDVVFGSVVSGRSAEIEGIEHMVGLLIDTVPVRVQIEEEKTFPELLEKMYRKALASKSYEYLPLADIQSLTPLNRQLINHIMIFENYPVQKEIKEIFERECGFKVERVELLEQTHYDFNIAVVPGESFLVKFSFNSHLYEMDQVRSIEKHFIKVLRQIASNSRLDLKAIEIVPEKEKNLLLYQFNSTYSQYPADKTIHQLFAAQVQQTPDQVALTGQIPNAFGVMHLTYRELDKTSNRLAHLLREQGVKIGTIVAVIVERSLDMIIGLLGILKAGSAYLPIDVDYPQKRINYMLKDSGAALVLTGPVLESLFSHREHREHKERPAAASRQPVTGLAYIIYTSGSTGKPKGVPVSHQNVVRLVKNSNFIDFTTDDRLLLTGAAVFDITTFEIWWPLLNGLLLDLVEQHVILDGEKLKDVMVKDKISILHLTPQLFNQLAVQCLDIFAGLKYFLVGGDLVRPRYVNRLRNTYKHVKILHMYGPTENTTFSTFFPVNNHYETTIPIGKPISNSTVYILDKHANLQPIGVVGELCTGGDGVARGYLNNPELTAEKFCLRRPGGRFLKKLPPWTPRKNFLLKGSDKDHMQSCNHTSMPPCNHTTMQLFPHYSPQSPIYRTGDLARWLPDGNIEFIDRIDSQVKIRGSRIELGEIENQLLKKQEINEAAVVAKENKLEEKFLCAYIVSREELDRSRLRDYLTGTLPDYMIPSHFVQLDKIPLTSNGKVDIKALPEPGIKIGRKEYAAPGDEIEEKLVEIWSEVLNINNNIGIHDNFFELGGHSLKATMVASKIHKEFNVKIPLPGIFLNPTIEKLAKTIKQTAAAKYASIEPVEERESYELSSAQKRLYILQQMEPMITSYHISGSFELEGVPDIPKLEESFRQLIQRHESFRTSFQLVKGTPVQRIHDHVEFESEYYGAERMAQSAKPESQSIERNKERCAPGAVRCASFIRPFDLAQAPLLRVGLIKTNEQKYILMVDMHHIISDGSSMGVFIKDLMTLYKGEALPGLRIRYQDYSQWHNRAKDSGSINRQETYWLNQLAGEIPVLNLPLDYPRPLEQSFEGNTLPFEINEEDTEALKSLALKEEVTLFMLLLAITNVLLTKLSGQEEIIVAMPVAARRHADLQEIIGMFVNTLVLWNKPAGNKPFNTFLKEVKEKILNAYENQEYPFEDLVEKVSVRGDAGRNPLFDVIFALQNIEANEIEIPGLTLKPSEYENKTSKFDLTIIGEETGNKLFFTAEYCTKLFNEETILRFITYFKNLVSSIIDDRKKKISGMSFIPEEEKQQLLYDFNDTRSGEPTDKTLHELFKEQAERVPDHIALVGKEEGWKGRRVEGKKETASCGQVLNAFGEMQLSYGELNEKSNQLAYLLIEKGVKPDTIAAIMMERSIEMIIGILGILKAGGAYLPIELGDPQNRINYMLNDGKVKLLVKNSNIFRDSLIRDDIDALFINDVINKNCPRATNLNPHLPPAPATSLAYIIYTSGTTGKPKGNLTTHANVIRVVKNTNYIELTGSDRILQLSNYAFDGSVFDIYGALLNGSVLVLVDRDKVLAVDQLAAMIKQQQVTVFFVTTALFNTLIDMHVDCFHHIRKVLFGGERVSVEHTGKALEYMGKGRVIHVYGPTETTVYATYYFIDGIDEEAVTIPIGMPITNTAAYILDKYLQLVPIGVTGELYIGGDGLARGYLNRPELTSEKFLPVFYRSYKSYMSYIYRTGDLVRRLLDGNIEFIGRIDGQIKIRGFRVELGEIEKRLLIHGQIQEAVVIARELGKGNQQLVAYIVPQSAGAALSDGPRKYLSGFLPGYMIPSYFVELDKLPLTPNGKVDRDLLPIPGTFKHYPRESYAAPASDMEKLIADIWKEMLKLEKVGIDDNFFDIGGNSLNILQVNKKLNSVLESPLPIMTMFRYTTIRSLSEFLSMQETKNSLDRKKRAEALEKGKSDRLKRYQKREQRNRKVEIKERIR